MRVDSCLPSTCYRPSDTSRKSGTNTLGSENILFPSVEQHSQVSGASLFAGCYALARHQTNDEILKDRYSKISKKGEPKVRFIVAKTGNQSLGVITIHSSCPAPCIQLSLGGN